MCQHRFFTNSIPLKQDRVACRETAFLKKFCTVHYQILMVGFAFIIGIDFPRLLAGWAHSISGAVPWLYYSTAKKPSVMTGGSRPHDAARPLVCLDETSRQLSDVHFPNADTIVLVQDNLNIHAPASLYKAFPPDEARRIAERFEWHYTPGHGSLARSSKQTSCQRRLAIYKRASSHQTEKPVPSNLDDSEH